MSSGVGILAYGSLIDDPGQEIKSATVRIVQAGVVTPFKVEFARSSRIRAGAPTLVPVENGGAHVCARILVMSEHVSVEAARNMLWRRETGTTRLAPYATATADPGPNRVTIECLKNFHGVGVVLYTNITANIRPVTAQRLAELAIASARSGKIAEGRDGISYLIAALRHGISTPMSAAYVQEVKRQAGAVTLCEALKRVRGQRPNPTD
jgi:cation transport regulator ChaC